MKVLICWPNWKRSQSQARSNGLDLQRDLENGQIQTTTGRRRKPILLAESRTRTHIFWLPTRGTPRRRTRGRLRCDSSHTDRSWTPNTSHSSKGATHRSPTLWRRKTTHRSCTLRRSKEPDTQGTKRVETARRTRNPRRTRLRECLRLQEVKKHQPWL